MLFFCSYAWLTASLYIYVEYFIHTKIIILLSVTLII